MSRDPKLFLDDIRESSSRILRYTHGLSYADFETDDKTVDAVVRNLAVIGEAVKRLPQELFASVILQWSGRRLPAYGTS